MRRSFLVAAFAVAALAGCSLLTDLAGLSSGGPPNDGRATDAPRSEGGVTLEASTGGEGGADGGVLADASGCARYPGATFCVDFDHPNDLATPPWTLNDALELPAPGTIALTSTGPISAPSAARFDLADLAPDCQYLRLGKQVDGTFTKLTAHVAMRSENDGVYFTMHSDAAANLSFSILVAMGISTSVRLFVQQRLNGTLTEIGNDDALFASSWVGQWLDLTLEYTDSPTKSVSLTVPGLRKLTVGLPSTFVALNPDVGIGPYCYAKAAAATFDDFAIFAVP